MSRGHYYAEHGRDPSPDFAAAEKDLSDALEKDPGAFDIRLRRANNRMFRGVYERPPVSEPLEQFQRAEADLLDLTSRPRAPLTTDAWRALAGVRLHRGNHVVGLGRDPGPDFASAEAALDAALKLSAREGEIAAAHAHFGLLYSTWATHLWKTSRDPDDPFKKAEEHFAKAIKSESRDSWYYRLRATCLVSRAEYRESRSEDPFPDYARAEDDLQRSIELRRDLTSAWRERAQLRFGRAAAWEKRGEKERARKDYSGSANDYLETLSLNRRLQDELGPRLADARRKAAELGD
jgi:tetratricopeptide (TPR) repeat protein